MKTTIDMARALSLARALAQPAPVQPETDLCGSGAGCLYKVAMIEHLESEVERLKAAQPAPAQEPACWQGENGCPNRDACCNAQHCLYTTPPAAQPAPVQEPEIDGATMAGMDASIGHLSALVDELRLLLGCAMDNFEMLHNAAKPDDGPDMDAIIPAIVFAKFVNQDAALRYAIKHSAHDGMITAPPAAKPAPCTWTKSPDPHMPDTFDATCGVVWTFTDGGPAENDVRFCPGCGAAVSVADPEPEEDLFDLAVKADNGGQP